MPILVLKNLVDGFVITIMSVLLGIREAADRLRALMANFPLLRVAVVRRKFALSLLTVNLRRFRAKQVARVSVPFSSVKLPARACLDRWALGFMARNR